MGYTVAITGKGGTGKTTVASLVIDYLKAKKKGTILAIDADPNSNLAQTLGIKVEEDIAGVIDKISKNPDSIQAGMSKNEYIEYRTQTAIAESDSLDILVMGRPEGPGCYCYVNNLLRNLMGKFIRDYDYVVIDNAAGMEHLSRRITPKADCLVLVSDETPVGIRAVERIYELAKELSLSINKTVLFINRSNHTPDTKMLKDLKIDYIGVIPFDKELFALAVKDKAIINLSQKSEAKKAIWRIADKLWP